MRRNSSTTTSADGGIDLVAVGEQAPELARRPCGGRSCAGAGPSSGRSSRTIGCHSRLHEGDGGTQQREALHAVGRAQADLDRDAPAHRVADEVRALDAQRVHHVDDGVGEPARRVGRRPAAWTTSRSPAGRGRGRGSRSASAPRRCRRTRTSWRRGRGSAGRRGPRPSSASRRDAPAGGRRGCAAAAGGRWAGGTGPRSRRPGRGRRARRAGAGSRPRRPTARPGAAPARWRRRCRS